MKGVSFSSGQNGSETVQTSQYHRRMSSTYSRKVNEALERYGAKTHGSLERRVERLKRFTDATNKRYAAQIRIEETRQRVMEEQEQRVQQRIRELEQEVEIPVYHVITGYNLRPRQENGLSLLLQAIENGHVKTRRG